MKLGLGLGLQMARRGASGPSGPTGIVLSTNELADDHDGAFATMFMVGGTEPPQSFTLLDPPEWLSREGDVLSADGTQTAGEAEIMIRVTDANGLIFDATLPLTISESAVEPPFEPPSEDDPVIADPEDPEFDGGGFEQVPVSGSTSDGLKITGKNGGSAALILDWGTVVAEGIYTMRYTADFSQLNRQGREAAVGFAFKDGNDFHLVSLRGNGNPNTSMLRSKIHGDFRKANQFTITNDGAAENGTKSGPNWLQIEIDEAGEAYTLRSSLDGEAWDVEYTDALPVPLDAATDALQFGPAAYFTNQDKGVFQITVERYEAEVPSEAIWEWIDTKLVGANTTGTNTFTFDDVDFGPAEDGRWILIPIGWVQDASGNRSINSMTLVGANGDNALTRVIRAFDNHAPANTEYWLGQLPAAAGTSGSVRIVTNSTTSWFYRIRFAVGYFVDTVMKPVALETDRHWKSTNDNLPCEIELSAEGHVTAMFTHFSTTDLQFTAGGLDELYSGSAGNNHFSRLSETLKAGTDPLAITTQNSVVNANALVGVVWGMEEV